jgi:hypothetical protein
MNPDMHFLSLKVIPENEHPPVSPTGAPMRRDVGLQGLFHIYLKFLINIPQNK